MLSQILLGITIYLFGSGLAFFLGVIGVWTSIAVFLLPARRWMQRTAVLFCLVGIMFIGLSAAPIPYTFYILGGTLTVTWLVVEHSTKIRFQPWLGRLRILTAAIWLVAVLWELPYLLPPTVAIRGNPSLFVIADSITAGVGEREAVTWPKLLQRAHPVSVHDFSRMGAGVAAGYSQAERLPEAGGLVLLEIGGNDLLGVTSLSAYAEGLDRLLKRVTDHGRTVIMFELPLPPFCNEFGRIQRQAAARYRVPLIPKRDLAQILATPGNTLDSIHLSQAGHNEMSKLVWSLIRPAYPPEDN